MHSAIKVLLAVVVLSSVEWSACVKLGDEGFGPIINGQFFVFADQAVQIISPINGSVTRNITADQSGAPLTNNGSLTGSASTPRNWGDAVYVRGSAAGQSFIAINEGDQYGSSNSSYGYVTIVNTAAQRIISRVQVGPRPVHIYSINQTSTAWSHADGDGYFYVIPANSSTNVSVGSTVKAFRDQPGHGKLVVDDALYPVGYATNVNEQVLPKINLTSATIIGYYPYKQSLANASLCTGTHSAVYSRRNRHVFFECIGGGGTLEWNTVNDSFVALHPISGALTAAPASDLVFVASNVGSQAAIIVPGTNGQPSTAPAVLSVAFNPAYPQFWSNSTNSGPLSEGNFTAYKIYFPLTRNTNLNNIRSAGDNVTTLAYMTQPSDCTYAGQVVASSLANSTGDSPSSSSNPGLTLATQGGSVLTPQCGACAPGINTTDPSQFNASLSGLGVYNLNGWSSGPRNASTTLVSAGATLPAANSAAGANQCAFSTSNYRQVKRGGNYMATVARLPQPALYLINAANSDSVSFVATSTRPTTIVWVPSS